MPLYDYNHDLKLVTIPSPITEVTCQELVNDIREEERDIKSLNGRRIAIATGKQLFATGKKVGITLDLVNDWMLAFEARPGPSWETCFVRDGNIVATDVFGVKRTTAIYPTPYVNVIVEQDTSAAIVEVGGAGSTADAVWKASMSDYRGFSGSMAEAMSIIQGLLHLNTVVKNFTYNATTGKLEGVELVTYDSKANAQANDGITGVIHEFTADASYINSQPSQFRIVVEP